MNDNKFISLEDEGIKKNTFKLTHCNSKQSIDTNLNNSNENIGIDISIRLNSLLDSYYNNEVSECNTPSKRIQLKERLIASCKRQNLKTKTYFSKESRFKNICKIL